MVPLTSRNRPVLTLIFSLYFLSYAVSPLSCDLTGRFGVERTSHADVTPLSVRTVHIFLWELICVNISEEKNRSTSSSGVKILIKKAGAIIPHKSFLKSGPLVKNASANALLLLLFFLFLSVLRSSYHSVTQKVFTRLSAGRSPPLQCFEFDVLLFSGVLSCRVLV